jgi:Rhodanese-like domain
MHSHSHSQTTNASRNAIAAAQADHLRSSARSGNVQVHVAMRQATPGPSPGALTMHSAPVRPASTKMISTPSPLCLGSDSSFNGPQFHGTNSRRSIHTSGPQPDATKSSATHHNQHDFGSPGPSPLILNDSPSATDNNQRLRAPQSTPLRPRRLTQRTGSRPRRSQPKTAFSASYSPSLLSPQSNVSPTYSMMAMSEDARSISSNSSAFPVASPPWGSSVRPVFSPRTNLNSSSDFDEDAEAESNAGGDHTGSAWNFPASTTNSNLSSVSSSSSSPYTYSNQPCASDPLTSPVCRGVQQFHIHSNDSSSGQFASDVFNFASPAPSPSSEVMAPQPLYPARTTSPHLPDTHVMSLNMQQHSLHMSAVQSVGNDSKAAAPVTSYSMDSAFSQHSSLPCTATASTKARSRTAASTPPSGASPEAIRRCVGKQLFAAHSSPPPMDSCASPRRLPPRHPSSSSPGILDTPPRPSLLSRAPSCSSSDATPVRDDRVMVVNSPSAQCVNLFLPASDLDDSNSSSHGGCSAFPSMMRGDQSGSGGSDASTLRRASSSASSESSENNWHMLRLFHSEHVDTSSGSGSSGSGNHRARIAVASPPSAKSATSRHSNTLHHSLDLSDSSGMRSTRSERANRRRPQSMRHSSMSSGGHCRSLFSQESVPHRRSMTPSHSSVPRSAFPFALAQRTTVRANDDMNTTDCTNASNNTGGDPLCLELPHRPHTADFTSVSHHTRHTHHADQHKCSIRDTELTYSLEMSGAVSSGLRRSVSAGGAMSISRASRRVDSTNWMPADITIVEPGTHDDMEEKQSNSPRPQRQYAALRRRRSPVDTASASHDDGCSPLRLRRAQTAHNHPYQLSPLKGIVPQSLTALRAEMQGTLPLVPRASGANQVISVDTVADLILSARFSRKYTRIYVLDCRYDYEYAGGYIRASDHRVININLTDPAMLEDIFFNNQQKATIRRDVCVIFHCEFSQQRGPLAYRRFRQIDRQRMGLQNHPLLHFPETYVMHGGYRAFHMRHPDMCEGDYRKMVDPSFVEHEKQCRAAHRLAWKK